MGIEVSFIHEACKEEEKRRKSLSLAFFPAPSPPPPFLPLENKSECQKVGGNKRGGKERKKRDVGNGRHLHDGVAKRDDRKTRGVGFRRTWQNPMMKPTHS